jgi:ABC-type multidrug transport system ATPase subunit
MRRRLNIAMSLIRNPPVIFLGEPTAGLDPEERLKVWQAVSLASAPQATRRARRRPAP